MIDDDQLTFADEAPDDATASAPSHHAWRVLIVDDDEQVHSATLFSLQDIVIHGRRLEFLHAHSSDEARAVLEANRDIAVIFLDVVMEKEDSGLRMVKVIREDLGMVEARIILRTGQPGYAPEVDVISNYDINDYRTKSELTRTRLITTLTAAVRSFEQIRTNSESRKGLEKIVHASATLFEKRALESFAEGVLTQIASVLGVSANGVVCAQRGAPLDGSDPDNLYVISAVGRFAGQVGHRIEDLDDNHIRDDISRCIQTHASIVHGTTSVIYLAFEQREAAVYIDSPVPLVPLDRQLIEVFTANISVGYANVNLFERLNDLAYVDALTGLPNRRHLIDDLAASATSEPITLCVVDIDHFSEINDALGSTCGDQLLVAAAQRLRQALPGEIKLARCSSDIFAIFGPTRLISPTAVIASFHEPFMLDAELPLTASVSLGIVSLEGTAWNASEAMQQALIAVGRAKREARGNAIRYVPSMTGEARVRLDLLHELRMAMRRQKLELYFQPQIELAGGTVIGAEALLRWRRDDGSFTPPDRFIPLAERSGLIVELGEWVLNESFRHMVEWSRSGLGHLRLAINVAMPQFRADQFALQVRRMIEHHGLAAGQVEIEITESTVMQDVEATISTLTALRDIGVGIAIDDFGTGFSSLAYLQRLPVDVMKIDRSFVHEIGGGGAGERIARQVADLARTLELKTVAEGVEHATQATALRNWGCDFAQGFHYSPAVDSPAFIDWVGQYHAGLRR